MINIVKDKGFKVVDGKWLIGNLNDKLVAASFDVFINLRRKTKVDNKPRVKRNLSHHNYKFKYS